MRLINADMLLQEINGSSMRITGFVNAMSLMIMDETKKSIMRIVDEQPTVFDIDKVKEEIKKIISYYELYIEDLVKRIEENGEDKMSFEICSLHNDRGYLDGLKKSLEIIKSCGVNKNGEMNNQYRIPKKIVIKNTKNKKLEKGNYVFYKCPECDAHIASGFYYPLYNEFLQGHKFCKNCGQAIDWSE